MTPLRPGFLAQQPDEYLQRMHAHMTEDRRLAEENLRHIETELDLRNSRMQDVILARRRVGRHGYPSGPDRSFWRGDGAE